MAIPSERKCLNSQSFESFDHTCKRLNSASGKPTNKMCITLSDVHTVCINTTAVLVNSHYGSSRSIYKMAAIYRILCSISIKVHLEIIIFGENTTIYYKNWNMIYSLLSQSNGNTGIYNPREFKNLIKKLVLVHSFLYRIFNLPEL